MKYNRRKMNRKMKSNLENKEVICSWCGNEISNPTKINFAHIKGKNVGNANEAENGFLIVCANFHIYQTVKAGNLESDPCVASYLSAGGGGKGYHFFDLLIEKRNKQNDNRT